MGVLNAIETIIGTIKFKRGLKENLTTLKYGEPAYIYDENELYIGGKDGDEIVNKKITRNSEVAANTEAINNLKTSVAQNTSSLNEKANKSNDDITYYVDSATGNDNNDGLSNNTAFKTINKAIELLPQFIYHNIIINVGSGNYVPIILNNLQISSTLTIRGEDDINTNVNIENIKVNNVHGNLIIKGFNITTITDESININYSNCVNIQKCNIIGTARKTGILANYSKIVATSCVISNKDNAIYAKYMSDIFSDNNSGSNNSKGLNSIVGSKIIKNGANQPIGTVNEGTLLGGEIV